MRLFFWESRRSLFRESLAFPYFALAVSTGVMLIAAGVGTIWSFLQVVGYRRNIGLSFGIFLCCTAPWIIQAITFPAMVGLTPNLAIWLTAALIAAASYASSECIVNLVPRFGGR